MTVGKALVLAVAAWIGACGDDEGGDDGAPSDLEQGCIVSCCEGTSADPACVEECGRTVLSDHRECVVAYEDLGACAAGLTCCGSRACSALLTAARLCTGDAHLPDAGPADSGVPGCDFRSPEVPVVCSNELDDDCDGLVDCDDPECASIEACGGGGGPDAGPAPGGCADEPAVVAVRTYPGTGGQQVSAAARAPNDDLVIVGSNFGRVDFGSGAIDAGGERALYVVRVDPAGEASWTAQLSGDNDDLGIYGVAVDEEGAAYFGGYVTGTIDLGLGPTTPTTGGETTRESFVVKVDAGGATEWVHRYGFGTTWGLATAPDGGVWAIGDFSSAGSNGPADFGGEEIVGPGNADVFLLRLDSDGEHVRSQPLGGPNPDQAYDVAVAANGDVALAVLAGDGADFGDGVVNRDGGDAGDFHVLRLSDEGELVWGRKVDGGYGGADVAFDDATGGILMSGVVELDANGDETWRSAGVDAHGAFALDADRGVWLFGSLEPMLASCALGEGQEILMARLGVDSCGDPLRARTVRRGAEDVVSREALLIGSDGEIAVVGTLTGTEVDLGDGPIAATESTVFLARYRP